MAIVDPEGLVVLVLEISGVEPSYNFQIIEDCRQQNLDGKIMLVISAYDDDPRELWEIDEVREHLEALRVMGIRSGLKHWRGHDFTSVFHEQTYNLFYFCTSIEDVPL